MFRALIPPIVPQAVTHSLVPLKMGGINARNVLSWLELLTNHSLHLVGVYIIYINYARSNKYNIFLACHDDPVGDGTLGFHHYFDVLYN